MDFKRPAGGILDLTEARMDDEQYFAKVQAEVTERTLEDIGSALDTLKDPLVSTFGKNKDNIAVPTSADTPEGEENNTVDFQKSVVATQRFDISEPGWEERLQAFVNDHLCGGGAVLHAGAEQAVIEPPYVELSPRAIQQDDHFDYGRQVVPMPAQPEQVHPMPSNR